jgi:carboxyl-terminal processing protease
MKKYQVWLPLLFALVLIAGMWIGSGLQNNLPASRGIFETSKRSSLQEVVDLVNLKYVDKINTDTLTDDAIQAILSHLDPHSVFIPASHLGAINDDLKGNFGGVGIDFFIIDDSVHITTVLAGGPSDKAGIKAGDIFLKVDSVTVTGTTIDTEKIRKLLKGKSKSKVQVTVLRNNRQIVTTIIRGTIPIYSVDASYMIDTETGYIHLNKFSGTTYEEFMKAMEELQAKGMKKLVFDLRDNGGGILGEAVDIVDEFLNEDKLIVYTQGESEPKTEYRCKRPGLFENGKVALLVDETSASASEVVAGALQDWDRATIIGRRTFGKGLVQDQYDLSDGSALRLTIARYYTPVGRNIQKPYVNGREAYNDELEKRMTDGELVKGDTVAQHTGPKFKTKGGRIVYGGGGITPDVFVPFDTTSFLSNAHSIFNSQFFYEFIYRYYHQNQAYFSQFKNAVDFAQHFNRADDAWNAFLQYAAKDSIKLPSFDKEEADKRIKVALARQIWRMEGYYEVTNLDDTMIAKAMETIKK